MVSVVARLVIATLCLVAGPGHGRRVQRAFTPPGADGTPPVGAAASLLALGDAASAEAGAAEGQAFPVRHILPFGLLAGGARHAPSFGSQEAAALVAASRLAATARVPEPGSAAAAPVPMPPLEAATPAGIPSEVEEHENIAAARPGAKVAIVTGASTGVGLATVAGMARSGRYGKIILAGRDKQKHEGALASLRSTLDPSLPVVLEYAPMDLSVLASVRDFAASFTATGQALDTLVLNAGVMAIPDRRLTRDGNEYQFGVNHLGHFLLANLLLDTMVRSGSPQEPGRVIALSSSAHQIPSPLGRGDVSDLQSRAYSPWVAYGQSKLANLLFIYELDRRCREHGLPIAANAVHPGVVDTELWRFSRPSAGRLGEVLQTLARPLTSLLLKSPEDGAKTTVMLATGSEGKLSGRFWQDERPAPSVDIDSLSQLPEPLQALIPDRLNARVTSYDPRAWAALRRESETMVGLQPGEAEVWAKE